MKQILVVDDEFPIREWLVRTIRENRPDYAVHSASNGLTALNELEARNYQLVISDIRMPQLDGLGLFERMKAIYPDIGIIVLSSYDDYNYVRSAFKQDAVDYLLKAEITEESLLASVDHYYEEQKAVHLEKDISLILRESLNADDIAAKDFDRRMAGCQITVPEKNYFLYLVRTAKPLIPNVKHAVSVFTASLGNEEYLGCVSLCDLPSTLAQLQVQSAYIRELEQFNACALLLISEIQYRPGVLVEVFQNLYQYRSILFYKQKRLLIRKEAAFSFAEYFQLYLDVLGAIKLQNHEQLHERLSAFFDYAESRLFPDIAQLSITSIKILEELCLTFAETDAKALAGKSRAITRKISQCADMEQLKQTMLQEADSAFRQPHLPLNPRNPGSSRIQKAICYIEQNYAKPITLNEVANLACLNPEYFSRHFKKETGTNFNNYVNTVRLKRALELVSHTDRKLSEIAELCGFQSFSYFSKRFKEMFGCPPYTLRSMHKEEG